ncbi:MAG: hypothetical protein ACR2NS_14060 [Gemmatimonadaceae bacterium]
MTESEHRRILNKYLNSSVHQDPHRGGVNQDGNTCRLSLVHNSEFPFISGFAIDEEGTLEFKWFTSQELLVAQLAAWLAERSSSGKQAAPPPGLMQVVRSYSKATESRAEFESRIEVLIEEAYPEFPLAWVGHFTTLCMSTGAFPEEVRLRFWMTRADEYLTAVIPRDLYTDFAHFLDGLREV